MEFYSTGVLHQQHKHIIISVRSWASLASSVVPPIGFNHECVNRRRALARVDLTADGREVKAGKFYPLFPAEYELFVLNNVFYMF